MIKVGKIIKGIGGFYYVKTDMGVIECRARGKFRKDSLMPYVGDDVSINIDNENGYVMDIFPRKNYFIRPPISNVDKLVLVAAVDNPKPDLMYIDKMTVTASVLNVEIAICFNKSDLNPEATSDYVKIYSKAGYNTFVTSTKDGTGIDGLREYMRDSVTALCGFSGVGKSSLINSVTNRNLFQVGEISLKLNRGKHTTRHVELVEYDKNSYFADTPGFSMLNLPDEVNHQELIKYFPDLMDYSYECKFSDCSHTGGKFCSVYNAMLCGDVSNSRYNNYVDLYNTLKDNKEWK
ncbi:MAG: ribosome small subunit-dependent GTPase A [Clostridia bacterium]|nr:ribosome small subunit-dependent GTPase A [Clostridia bacterium]